MPPFTIKHITIILSRARSLGQRDFFGLPVMHEAICAKWPFITKLCRFYSITLNHGLGRPFRPTFEKNPSARDRHVGYATRLSFSLRIFLPFCFFFSAGPGTHGRSPRCSRGIRKARVSSAIASLRDGLITATLLRTVVVVMRI